MNGDLILERTHSPQTPRPAPQRSADAYVDEVESRLLVLVEAVLDNLVRLVAEAPSGNVSQAEREA